MIYLLVLIGSAATICAILALRSFFEHRSVRSFVRSVESRSASAKEKGLHGSFQPVDTVHKKAARTMALDIKTVRELTTKSERFMKQGDMKQAELCLIEALKYRERSEDIRAHLAKLYLMTGRAAKAEALYNELLMQSDNPSYKANLGLACYHLGKYAESCEAYESALADDPSSHERQFAYAHPLMALGRFDEAISALEHAEQRLYRNPHLFTMLADCHMQTGRPDNAREAYRKLARLQPSNREAREKLAALA